MIRTRILVSPLLPVGTICLCEMDADITLVDDMVAVQNSTHANMSCTSADAVDDFARRKARKSTARLVQHAQRMYETV